MAVGRFAVFILTQILNYLHAGGEGEGYGSTLILIIHEREVCGRWLGRSRRWLITVCFAAVFGFGSHV